MMLTALIQRHLLECFVQFAGEEKLTPCLEEDA